MIPLTIGNLKVWQLIELVKSAKTNNNINILSALTRLPEDYFNDLPIKKLKLLTDKVGFLLSDYQDFLDGKNKTFRKRRWNIINGKLYIASKNADYLNTNQYTAMRTYDVEKQLECTLAVIYKQFRFRHVLETSKGEKTYYLSAKFNTRILSEVEKDMLNVKVKKVYGMLFFYSIQFQSKNKNIRSSLIMSQVEIMMGLLKTEMPQPLLDEVMDGITLLTKLPMERPIRL